MFVLKDLEISLVNVINTPIEGELSFSFFTGSYLVKGPFQLTKGSNTVSINVNIPGGPTSEFLFTISNSQYATSHIRVRIFDEKNFVWDNPGADCVLQNGVLTIKLTMIRLRQATISPIPKGLKQDVFDKPDTDVSKHLNKYNLTEKELTQGVWDDPDLKEQRYWGLESYDKTLEFKMLRNENGVPINKASEDEWERFFYTTHSVRSSTAGGFIWLEYGAVEDNTNTFPRFLVGLWVPKQEGNKPVDVIINFSHSAAAWKLPGSAFPYRSGYPYPITKTTGITPGHPQAYVHFGMSYLFEAFGFAFYFVPQSIASEKPVVIINPILPLDGSGNFGKPFTNQQGLYRLVLEVKQFLFQEGYSQKGGIHFDEWQGKAGRVGMIQNPYVINAIFMKSLPPQLKTGNIVVTAHSSGQQFITSIINASRLPQGMDFPVDLWGASEAEFVDQWKEIWDLDIAHTDGLNVEKFMELLLGWYKRGNRVLRVYRSMQTNSGPTAFDKLNKIATLTKTTSNGSATAVYWHNDKEDLSFLWLNNGYTTKAKPSPDIFRVFMTSSEPWWRFHQVPVILGFGHAAKMRLTS